MHSWQMLARVFVLFLCSSFSYASEPKPPERIGLGNYPAVIAFLNQYIPYIIDEEDLSGLSVAIVNGKNIVWEKGFGFADIDLKVASKPSTYYQAGAITGLLTAALAVRLAEKGMLNLDDDINKYLPDLVVRSRQSKPTVITVRNLLTHHAGLPINIFKNSWMENPPSFHSLINPSTKLNSSYPPETIYAFSNVGYSLLGGVIERVTGLSYSDAMTKYIFSPLGMKDSSVNNESDIVKKLSIGYKDGDVGEKLLPRDTPSVGLVTSVKDMTKFIRLYFLSKGSQWHSLAETIRVQNAHVKLDVGRKVGLSWYVDGMDIKGAGPVIWRGGATPYFRSRVAMLPDHELGIVVLSNDSKSWEVIEKISEKALQLMVEAKSGVKQPIETENKKSEKITSDPVLQKDRFSSAYSGFIGYVDIESSGEEYRANILGWPFVLSKDQENLDWYELEYDLLGFIPIDISWISGVKVRPAVVDGHRVLIVYYKGRQYLFAQGLAKSKVHDGWKSLIGQYQVKNSDSLLKSMKVSSGELVIKNDSLFLIYRLPFWFGVDVEIPLTTLSDESAIVPGLGTGLNEIVTVNKVSGSALLEYSGYVLERQNDPDDFIFFD